MILPLDTFENRHCDHEKEEAVFRSLIAEIGGYNIGNQKARIKVLILVI
jgi:hypothetical protein